MIDVTITHNLKDVSEVKELFRRQWIALDWGRNGPNPELYTGRGRTDVTLFNQMRTQGAAVIAAYKRATAKSSDRLIGMVEAGTEFESLNELLCLPLSEARIVDASTNFLGNLSPRSCTVQRCENRARGRLAALVQNGRLARELSSLHHRDVEWLVTNYLILQCRCECIWTGNRSFEGIDHVGITHEGRELLAQTTVSTGLVHKKAALLLAFARENRDLLFFGPEISRNQCPNGIEYHPIEKVFAFLEAIPGGRWLIDRMLTTR